MNLSDVRSYSKKGHNTWTAMQHFFRGISCLAASALNNAVDADDSCLDWRDSKESKTSSQAISYSLDNTVF